AGYFTGTLYWLIETMTTFGGLATPVAAFAAAMLIAYLSLFPALFALVLSRLVRAFGRGWILSAPLIWVASEMGRTYVLDGFPWELLGYSQAGVLPIAQLASLVGVYGLSGFVAMVSAVAAYATLARGVVRWRAIAVTLAAVVAVG